ncbi:MAG TPA: response regulator [Acidobacteriaceae bacterium]|nr:response regulator [Acidobacteriaceae bacterium]
MPSGSDHKRLLIVDDEKTIADSLVRIFSVVGYETRCAYSAEEARALLAAWAPDLAILDVCLPLMNGIDLAILLKAEYPDCRLVLFSGNSDTEELLQMALRRGHTFDLFAKPIHPTELLTWAAGQNTPLEPDAELT